MSFCIQMEGSFRSSVKEGLADQSVLNSQFSLPGISLKDRRKITTDMAPVYVKTCDFFLLKKHDQLKQFLYIHADT